MLGTALLLISALAYSQPCSAQVVHLWLTVDGQDIEGFSDVLSMDRENTIMCHIYGDGFDPGQYDGGTAGAGTRKPIVCTKRLDRASPRLWQALENGERVEGTFRFYRPNPAGDGTVEWYYTVELQDARIAAINTVLRGPTGGQPVPGGSVYFEEVKFIYRSMVRIFQPTGTEYRFVWGR